MANIKPEAPAATPMDSLSEEKSAMKMHEYTDKSCIPKAAATLSASFTDDPMMRWMMTKRSQPLSLIDTARYRDGLFNNGILPMAIASGGTVVDPDGEWNCVGIIISPCRDHGAPSVYLKTVHRLVPVAFSLGFSPTYKAMFTYPTAALHLLKLVFPPSSPNPAVSQRLKTHEFFYVFFLGTLPTARGRGLGGAFIRLVQSRASSHIALNGKPGVPVYFECSKESSRLFYEHLGFKTVGMTRMGKGEVDEMGMKEQGGKGARFWAMVWWPDGMWPEGVEYWDGKQELVF